MMWRCWTRSELQLAIFSDYLDVSTIANSGFGAESGEKKTKSTRERGTSVSSPLDDDGRQEVQDCRIRFVPTSSLSSRESRERKWKSTQGQLSIIIVRIMEYCMPPPAPDHDAAHYQHYQYAAGQPPSSHPISVSTLRGGKRDIDLFRFMSICSKPMPITFFPNNTYYYFIGGSHYGGASYGFFPPRQWW